MTQIILLKDEKKLTIFNTNQPSDSLAQALESGKWDLPDEIKDTLDLDEMRMVEMPNFLMVLPKDFQWEVQTTPQDEEVELSPRQHEVLQALADGFTTKQIAYRLGISQRTVMAHIQATKERFGTYTRAQTVSRAQSMGLIQAA